MANASCTPVLVIVLCGKRKSGKDYVAARLQELLGDSVSVLHLSKPLKEQYAKFTTVPRLPSSAFLCTKKTLHMQHVWRVWEQDYRMTVKQMFHLLDYCNTEHSLDAVRLMGSSGYKEIYRKDIIRWGEEKRAVDPGYYCRLAAADADKPVWLVCDARRPTDMDYFKGLYCCTTVRVVASEGVRKERGWEWVEGVDNAPSECALDGYLCDQIVQNDGNEKELTDELEKIRQMVSDRIR